MSKLQALLQQGENNAVEFKSANVSSDGLAREIVAFANTSGGSILIGVEDDGKITGIANPPQMEEWVANICRQNIVPPIQVAINIEKEGILDMFKEKNTKCKA